MTSKYVTKKQKFDWLEQAKDYIKQGDDYFEEFLVNQFDENYYGEGTLTFGKQKVEIESVWTDTDNHINIHVESKYYEGDVLMKSLSKSNQLKIIDMLWKHVENDNTKVIDYSSGEPKEIDLEG